MRADPHTSLMPSSLAALIFAGLCSTAFANGEPPGYSFIVATEATPSVPRVEYWMELSVGSIQTTKVPSERGVISTTTLWVRKVGSAGQFDRYGFFCRGTPAFVHMIKDGNVETYDTERPTSPGKASYTLWQVVCKYAGIGDAGESHDTLDSDAAKH